MIIIVQLIHYKKANQTRNAPIKRLTGSCAWLLALGSFSWCSQNLHGVGHVTTDLKTLCHTSHRCKVWLPCACWYETSVRKIAQKPFRNIHTRRASLSCACGARGCRVPHVTRMHAHNACTWMAFLRCVDGCVSVEWRKQWRPWHSVGTCRVSLRCVPACVYWGWMTERSVYHILCTGEDGAFRAHEECGYEADPACQRTGYRLCTGTSGRLDQRNGYI